uniref:Leucine Rich Repeat family protein n=1 Tax=Wuchereria bancrofti TaxID=6293 RepID=A0A1I8EP50_WUCBA
YTDLKELIIENCDRLHTIEKFAFKGLSHLKLLRLVNNPSLNNIARNAFSQISNRHGLRIQLINNSFTRIRQGLFRQLNHLREFTLQGQNLKIEVNAFASFTQIDFFNLLGVISFGLRSFENVSRIHRLEISHSQFSIPAGVFTALSHVREIHIISNKIDTINTEAFTGLYTIGSLIMSDNKIGNISGYAFATIVNIGEIIIERNIIRNLETEALISEAWQTRFQDNILYCSCAINWLKHINDSVLLKKNFCGAEEFHRSLLNYKPNCLRPKRGQSATITIRTCHFISIFCLFIVIFYDKTI